MTKQILVESPQAYSYTDILISATNTSTSLNVFSVGNLLGLRFCHFDSVSLNKRVLLVYKTEMFKISFLIALKSSWTIKHDSLG